MRIKNSAWVLINVLSVRSSKQRKHTNRLQGRTSKLIKAKILMQQKNADKRFREAYGSATTIGTSHTAIQTNILTNLLIFCWIFSALSMNIWNTPQKYFENCEEIMRWSTKVCYNCYNYRKTDMMCVYITIEDRKVNIIDHKNVYNTVQVSSLRDQSHTLLTTYNTSRSTNNPSN